MSNSYKLTEEQKKSYAGIYLLDYMINTPKSFPVFLDGNDVDLEPVLEWLLEKEYVEIQNKEKYIPTEKGREVLQKFMERYVDFLRVFDVFCAVDLEEGEFAFASYFEFDEEYEWREYLADERWEDLRVAVAEFKKIDPVEIVFMSFINEKRFGRDHTGWQFDLLLGSVWDDILEICETALHVEDLGYEDDEGEVTGEEVIQDIVEQGAELMLGLIKEEEDMNMRNSLNDNEEDDDFDEEEEYVDRVYMEPQPVVYYESYYDPFYISPIWLIPFLL